MSHFATISYLDKAFLANGNDTLQFEAGLSVGNRLTVTVLASISVNMNSPPSKSPFRYNSALKKEQEKQGVRTDSRLNWRSEQRASQCTCSLCRCKLEVPSSTRWPRGPADSCRRGLGDSGQSCDLAGLSTDNQHTHTQKKITFSNSPFKIQFKTTYTHRPLY